MNIIRKLANVNTQMGKHQKGKREREKKKKKLFRIVGLISQQKREITDVRYVTQILPISLKQYMKIKTQQKKKKETLIVKPIDVRTRAKTNTLISSRPFIHYKHDNKKIIIIRKKKKTIL